MYLVWLPSVTWLRLLPLVGRGVGVTGVADEVAVATVVAVTVVVDDTVLLDAPVVVEVGVDIVVVEVEVMCVLVARVEETVVGEKVVSVANVEVELAVELTPLSSLTLVG